MKYGYVRVSTQGQAKNGNSLDAQIDLLINEGVSKENIYIDASSGAKTDRIEFQKLLANLNSEDVLVVTKLDRFARSLVQGSSIIDTLIKRGVVVNILNIGRLDDSPASQLIRNIFLSFAEFERSMILERISEGKAIAKQHEGYREGRPKTYSQKQLNHALKLLETNSYNEVTSLTGISKSTLIRAKRVLLEKTAS